MFSKVLDKICKSTGCTINNGHPIAVKQEHYLKFYTRFVVECNQLNIFLQNLELLRLISQYTTLKHTEKLEKKSCFTTTGVAFIHGPPCSVK